MTDRLAPLRPIGLAARAFPHRYPLLTAKWIRNPNRIPVFIISRDWCTPLRDLVQWLEDEGMENIHIVDNASTYPPLLEYLERTPHNVIRLGGNFGHRSPWERGLIEQYAKDSPFIVTDSDVVPQSGSHGAVARFAKLLNLFPGFYKMGFGLRIDDIPDAYPGDFMAAGLRAVW